MKSHIFSCELGWSLLTSFSLPFSELSLVGSALDLVDLPSSYSAMTLLVGSCEMTYNVLSGTLNTTIPPYSGNVAPTNNVSSGTINTTIPPYSGNVAPTSTHTDLPQHNFKGSAALILWSARGIASGMQGVTTYFITIKLRRFKLGFNLLLRCHVECSWIGSGRSSL